MKTNQIKWRCVSLAVAFAVCMAVNAQPLINPSFEDAETEQENRWGDLAAGWKRWGNWVNREKQWTPTRSGNCLMGYHHWRIEENGTSGFYQDVQDIQEGSLCSFSIFAFIDENTNAESIELRIERMGGFESIASRVYPLSEIRRNGWGLISVSGTTKGDGARFLVIITPKQTPGRQGAIKFDDAELLVEAGGG